MLKKRMEAAQGVASRLYATEEAIDDAISKLADLTGFMPQARNDANLSALYGQEAIAGAAVTLNKLVEARSQIIETHNRLAETRDQLGLRERMMGSHNDKPPVVQGNVVVPMRPKEAA